jgi:hypothetical protein
VKEPESTPLHELGGDARVARIFRWSAIAAAVLTVIVVAGLLIWWWLSPDQPATEVPDRDVYEVVGFFPLASIRCQL